MRALVYRGAWCVEIEQIERPALPTPTSVCVAVNLTGICGTDLGIVGGLYHARWGVILGHEGVGVVDAVGSDVTTVAAGDPVVINPTFSCGQCSRCRAGWPNHCRLKDGTEMGVSAPGTFAEHAILVERFVHRLPPGAGLDSFVLTEPLSCVLTGVARLGDDLPSEALVLGGGPIGLLYGLVLHHRGLRVWVAETAEERRSLADSLFPELHHVASLEQASAPEDEWRLVVDTTGALAAAVIPLLAPGGTLLLVGLRPNQLRADQGTLADRSIRIIGSIDSRGTFSEAIELIAVGSLDLDRLLTHRISLDRFGDAFGLLGCDIEARRLRGSGRALKVALAP